MNSDILSKIEAIKQKRLNPNKVTIRKSFYDNIEKGGSSYFVYRFRTIIDNKTYGVNIKITNEFIKDTNFRIKLAYFKRCRDRLKYYVPPERTDCE